MSDNHDLACNVQGAHYDSYRELKITEENGHVILSVEDGVATLTPDQARIIGEQLKQTAKSAGEFI